MRPFRRFIAWLKRDQSGSPEDVAAAKEGERIRDEMTSIRLSTRSGSAAENYQTGRRSHR